MEVLDWSYDKAVVGFRLLTKFGEKGVINLGKVTPIIGGIIGASVDSATTNSVGNVARKLFIEAQSAKRWLNRGAGGL